MRKLKRAWAVVGRLVALVCKNNKLANEEARGRNSWALNSREDRGSDSQLFFLWCHCPLARKELKDILVHWRSCELLLSWSCLLGGVGIRRRALTCRFARGSYADALMRTVHQLAENQGPSNCVFNIDLSLTMGTRDFVDKGMTVWSGTEA